MLTPNDIRNPKRQSGFDHVGRNLPGRKPFQADVYGGKNDKAGRAWKGPRRLTALEAAQDYCDYVNGNPSVAAAPTLKSAGHTATRAPLPRDPEVEAALGVLRDAKGQRAGNQGYVYMIGEKRTRGYGLYVKIGYSTNPAARVPELQTGNPRRLMLIAAMEGTPKDEARLHAKYSQSNILQEWFVISPALRLEFPSDLPARVAA